jgi:hypothetical protein
LEEIMTDKKEKKQKWGKHMQIPEIRETLFALGQQLNPPRKDKNFVPRKKKVQGGS